MPYVLAMGKPQPIEVSLDAERIADLDRLAARLGMPREILIAEAVERLLDDADERPEHVRLGFETAAELDAFIKEGIEDIERGNTVAHEEVTRMLDSWIAEFKAKCR